MTSREFNRSFYIRAIILGIWEAFALFMGLGMFLFAEGAGVGGFIQFVMWWLMFPAALILYGLKSKEMYPHLNYLNRLFLTSPRHNGGDREMAKYFRQMWRRSLLVIPMIKELMDDKKTLELEEAAIAVSEEPKFSDF